jgi:hypothetical protein
MALSPLKREALKLILFLRGNITTAYMGLLQTGAS